MQCIKYLAVGLWMRKYLSSEWNTSQSSYSVEFVWERKCPISIFFTEDIAECLTFRKILNDYGGFLFQNKTETDTDWSRLQEWLSFTTCCEDTEGIKEAEGILRVANGPHGDCQVAQSRNLLKGRG